jgi:hypothetical protein
MELVNKQTGMVLSESDLRSKMMELQERICEHPEALIGDSPEYLAKCPLTHTFADGIYIRSIFLPKDMIFVTKIHKKTHPYFILSGKVSVLTVEGLVILEGPLSGITKAGTKRVIYTHEDTVWTTVHASNETDLDKLEEELIAKSFKEMDEILEAKKGGLQCLGEQ